MNTQTHRNYSATVKTILVASLLTLTTTSAFADSSFYNKTLFSPSDSILRAESRGRIMIYDGLNNETVERAA
jgi:hypothetical protein